MNNSLHRLPDIFSYTFLELKNFITEILQQPNYRAKQIFQWLYRDIQSFEQMTNIPKSLRTELVRNFSFYNPIIIQTLESSDHTAKYLMELEDGAVIEVVKMEYHHGISACISTQVGCKMHCAFCASGKNGFFRNLTAGEMIQQLLLIQRQVGKRVGSVVLMGSGEPLDNFSELTKFLNIVHNANGLNLGYRHITISTCGIAPKIYELADFKLPITLAISLHAPSDELRNRLVPINRKYPLAEIIQACKYYLKKTNRRITFEYSLIAGINDSPLHAKALGRLLSGLLCHVNLIPVNSAELPQEDKFQPSSSREVLNFQHILENSHIPTSIRRTLGDDIQAACGQLKCRYSKKS